MRSLSRSVSTSRLRLVSCEMKTSFLCLWIICLPQLFNLYPTSRFSFLSPLHHSGDCFPVLPIATMRPVTVALLATLLPAAFLIVALACLSAYLFLQLRASRTVSKVKNDDVAAKVEDGDILAPPAQLYDFTKQASGLSDISNPNWRSDAISNHCLDDSMTGYSPVAGGWPGFPGAYDRDGGEAWPTQILSELGYNGGVAVSAILSWLEEGSLQHLLGEAPAENMARHINTNIILQRLSLDCEPEKSFLPFTPEVHLWLRKFHKSLEGMACKSKVSETPCS